MTGTRLLLVDDEAALLDLLKKYLERYGFQVEPCTDPHAALALMEAAPGSYSLLVTDLTLPGMSGEELVERMRALNPTLPVIIASGYPYEPRLQGVEFLQKPFLPRMLVELIRRILETPNAASAAAVPGGG
jgi:two-component system cell cycle sensor histidine kinase/response regulator CckA